MDSDHGNGSSNLASVTEEKAVVHFDDESSKHSNSRESEHDQGIRENSETTTSEMFDSHTKSCKSSTSVPSFSWEDFPSDDFFHVDPRKILSSEPTNHNVPTKSEENTSPQDRERTNDVYSEPLMELEEIFGSSRSNSLVSVVTHESFLPTLSTTQSPPIQVMERPGGHDLDCVTAAALARPSTQLDWSIASNDSLFSIQIGNCSFSGDHLAKSGGDTHTHKELGRSGELDFSSEWYRSGELKSSSDLISLRQPSSATKGGDDKLDHSDVMKARVLEKPKENVHNGNMEAQGGINPDEANSHTDENKTNGESCTFPVKKSSSQPRYSCKALGMPSYCCKWPSCSCSCCCCSSSCCKSLSWPSCNYICPSCCKS